MPAGRKKWCFHETRRDLAESISRQLGISAVISRVLVNRGISTPEEAHAFLNPSLDDLCSPFSMKGMDDAVNIILKSLENGEKIVIYGDYDADGVTATALLFSGLKKFGADVGYFIPSRFQEGYGLQKDAIERLSNDGNSLLITVDCGINSVAEVDYCQELGMKVIITDHHYPSDKSVIAAPVINPLQKGCSYPFKELAGVGVAYKLFCALCEKQGAVFNPSEFLDLVALGTVADIVPLVGENRILVYYGLKKINENPRCGIRSLINASGRKNKAISSRDIAYGLAPFINAAGRMGAAEPAALLLMTEKDDEADKAALYLESVNTKRRDMENIVLEEAKGLMQEIYGEDDDKSFILLGKEGWHLGVIGIVAAKISRIYNRPAALVSFDGDSGRSSARSVPGFNITDALRDCSYLLERFGGHEQAAGFSVNLANMDELRKRLSLLWHSCPESGEEMSRLTLEGELQKEEINSELAEKLEKLEPFGAGNEDPFFCSRNWRVNSLRLVGKDKNHLKMRLSNGDVFIDPIFFGADNFAEVLKTDELIDIAFSLKNGLWQDRAVLNVELKDICRNESLGYNNLTFFDFRNNNNKLSALKGILKDLKEPFIYIGSAGDQNIISDSMPRDRNFSFVHPGIFGSMPKPESVTGECDLVFFHLPILNVFVKQLVDGYGLDKVMNVYLLYNHEDRHFNGRVLQAGLPEPEEVVAVFKGMESFSSRGNFFHTDRKDDLYSSLSFGLNDKKFARCVAILKEVKALNEIGDGWELLLKADLLSENGIKNTEGYRDCLCKKKESIKFQNYLLSAGVEELAALFLSMGAKGIGS